MKIKTYKYHHLPELLKYEIQEIEQKEFGHVPIVKSITWALPDITVIAFMNETLVGHLNLVLRSIKLDNTEYQCAGINNLIVNSNTRGKKIGSKLLLYAKTYAITELNGDLILLLCATELTNYYSKHQWEKVSVPVYYNQPTQDDLLWKAETMILPLAELLTPSNKIHLNGLPW